MPALLQAVKRHGGDFPGAPPAGDVQDRSAAALDLVRRQRRRDRYRHAAAGALATVAAAGLAGIVVALGGPDGEVYVAGEGAVTAEVVERPWGMTVFVEAQGLTPEESYVLYAVAEGGHRTYVASWRAADDEVELQGSCYLYPSQVARVEMVADGEVVEVLQPEP